MISAAFFIPRTSPVPQAVGSPSSLAAVQLTSSQIVPRVSRSWELAARVAVESVRRSGLLTRDSSDFSLNIVDTQGVGQTTFLRDIAALTPSANLSALTAANSTLAGIAGPVGTDPTLTLSYLSSGFQIPQLGFASFSERFNDASRYQFFLRTCPDDAVWAEAVLALCRHYGWTDIALLHSLESTSTDAAGSLIRRAQPAGVRIVVVAQINPAETNHTTWRLAMQTLKSSGTNVIVSRLQVLLGDTIRSRAWAMEEGLLTPNTVWISHQLAKNILALGDSASDSNGVFFSPNGTVLPTSGLPPTTTYQTLRDGFYGDVTSIGVEFAIGPNGGDFDKFRYVLSDIVSPSLQLNLKFNLQMIDRSIYSVW